MTRRNYLQHTALWTASGLLPNLAAADTALSLHEPTPRRVYQRTGFDPAHAVEHEEGGPRLGFANVPLSVSGDLAAGTKFEVRLLLQNKGIGKSTDWAATTLAAKDGRWSGSVRVPAGGWYRIEVRAKQGETVAASGSVEPVGAGEVFVIAGQSYAEGANDELLKIDDPEQRVSALDVKKHVWRTADDPQPNSGDGGTIWPPFANALLPIVQVPIGMINVAVGGTASRQWLPGEALYENLALAGLEAGRFRAVLWQQGESDVIEKIGTDVYVERLVRIRAALAERWGFAPPWLPAKSTMHPTVYNDPAGEGRIRVAIDRLWRTPGFRRGPDTDLLADENRGGIGTRRHFTGLGQRRAGLLWFAAVWELLQAGDA